MSTLTLTQIKKLLKDANITTKLPRDKKTLLTYLEAERCYPEERNFCSDKSKVCDTRNNICINEELIEGKNLVTLNYNGNKISGKENFIKQVELILKNTEEEMETVPIPDSSPLSVNRISQEDANLSLAEIFSIVNDDVLSPDDKTIKISINNFLNN